MREDRYGNRYGGDSVAGDQTEDHVAGIIVMQLGPEEFRVIVTDAGAKQEHTVTLPRHAREGLGLRRVPPVALVEESFRFLLERKEPGDIATSFVLPTIAGEFPEYPEEIRGRFG